MIFGEVGIDGVDRMPSIQNVDDPSFGEDTALSPPSPADLRVVFGTHAICELGWGALSSRKNGALQ